MVNIMRINNTKIKLIVFAIGIVLIGTCILLMLYFGVLQFNNPSYKQYPVRGVDVSSYQGDINWDELSKQNIRFAFIKATEGSSFVDEKFKTNFTNARKTNLEVGAYHFFSFDSAGETQADNFISQVPKVEGALPPVVDFEFYGDKEKNPPNRDTAKKYLNTLLNLLEQYYEKKPIIYATKKTYDIYLEGHYESYDIWIRSVFTKPKPLKNQTWTFWQYSNRKHLDGYNGSEYYIDMNVFNGSVEEFNNYIK